MLLYYIFSFLLVSFSYANQGASKSVSPENKKHLVLQWEVSHTRNTDQISLVFRQDTVELVTNTSFQTEELVRLGSFNTPRNSYFKTLEKRLYQYYLRLEQTIPISSLVKRKQKLTPPIHPHTPVLHINDQEVHNKHIYFDLLKNILFQEIKNKGWRCQECAMYKLLNKKNTKTKIQRTVEKNGKTITKSFTIKELDCRTKGKNSWECVDSEFGIFVLKKLKNKKRT